MGVRRDAHGFNPRRWPYSDHGFQGNASIEGKGKTTPLCQPTDSQTQLQLCPSRGCDIADCSGTHIYNFNPISYNLYDYEKRLEMLVRDPSGSNLGYAQMRINDGAAGSTVTVMDFSRNTVALINERFGVWSYQVFNDSTATYYVQDPRVLTALTGFVIVVHDMYPPPPPHHPKSLCPNDMDAVALFGTGACHAASSIQGIAHGPVL